MKPARLVALVLASLAFIVITAEATFQIVAGDKLLYSADPEIEYLPQPNQSVHPGGIDMRTNAFGMRSEQVEQEKPADVFRLLVVGDSIVFGHTNIHHTALATSLLSDATLKDGRRLEVLNVSATSWGPGNMLAWLDRFGMFDADATILVLSSHDIDDNRTFGPLDSNFPQTRPVLGSLDWVLRRFPAAKPATSDPRSAGDARRALPLLMDRLAALPGGACLILHETQEEREASGRSSEDAEIAALAEARAMPVIDDFRFISVSEGFVDPIHLSARGQSQLADAMKTCPSLAERLADA